MKPLRILLIGLAALAIVLVIVVALAFTPGVQTWVARKFAPATPELSVSIGHVDAGLHQTRLEDVRVTQPGLLLTLPSAEVEVGVLDAAGGKVEVKRLVAKGWILDLTAPNTATVTTSKKTPTETARTAFDGIFKMLELPVDLRVDGVDLSGEVILPEGRAQVAITGGGIAAGQDGKIALTADFRGSRATVLAVRGAITTRMNTPRTFERFEVAVSAATVRPQAPQGVKVDVSLIAAREAQGEAYAAAMRVGGREIFHADIKLPPGSAPLAGAWTLDANSADAAPLALGCPLPEFVAKGQGAFESDRLFSQIKAVGSLDASIDKLAAIQPEFAALGRLAIIAGFDVATQGDVIRLTKLDASVTGAQPVASVTALQAVEFNTATGALTAANPATELLRLTLDGLPLAWAKPFLGDLALTGEDVRGTFTASARDGGFALRPTAPITLTNLSVTQAGQPLVHGVDVSLAAQADYTPKGWNAEVTDLSARSAGATLFKLTAKAAQAAGDKQPLTASGNYQSDLAALATQPAVARSLVLKRGLIRGDFSVSSAATQQANLTLQIADLLGADSRPLASVAVQARADVDANGRIDAKVPIVITQAGRRSDLMLSAVVIPTGKETNIKAQLTSDALHVPDLMHFSVLSPTAPEPAKPEAVAPKPAAPTPAPTAPLWAGVTGELKLAFKSLVYSKDLQVTDMAGLITITPSALTLENIGAALKTGGSLKAGGGLTFDATHKQPYALKADVALTNVEPAPIMRALSPGEPSPVEGKFDLTTQLSGRAVDPSDFGDSAVGDIRLTSKGGTFKALSVRNAAIAEGVSQIASIAGIVQQFAGKAKPSRDIERTRAAADVTKQLGAIKFDELNVIVGRDDKNNMAIKDLSLISPIIRLVGSGQITYVSGVPLVRQPLLLNLQLGAKDQLAADLQTLKLLGNKQDKQGYAFLVEDVRLDGSLQSIGTRQLSDLISRALTN